MGGNVEELTRDLYRAYPDSSFQDPEYGTYRMTRGGAYSKGGDLARCDRRHGERYADTVGFRLACD
jgi:formylglycine-generating enzyme required for sulfatase activity